MSNDITKQDDKFDNPFGEYLTDSLDVMIEGSVDSGQLSNISSTLLSQGGLGARIEISKKGSIVIKDENGDDRVIIGYIDD